MLRPSPLSALPARVMAGALLLGAAPAQFAANPPPPPPDYSAPTAWFLEEDADTDRSADVFFIHATTSRAETWNEDIASDATNAQTDLTAGAGQASAFSDCCRRFAPRYRQATYHALTGTSTDRELAFSLAYEDVRNAFRAFVAHHNAGRPFIIAGHSQGAQHGLRLLRDEVAGKPIAARLVAAYLPGIGIPASALPEGIPACATPRQTGCLVSWNSFTPAADTSAYIARSLTRRGTGESSSSGATSLVCVNPVSFAVTKPATAFAAAQGGALPTPTPPGPLPRPRAGMVEARCDGNVLRVRTHGLPVETLPGGSLHMADIALFWSDIRANAVARVRSMRSRRFR